MDPDAIKVGRELEAADARFKVHSPFGEIGGLGLGLGLELGLG